VGILVLSTVISLAAWLLGIKEVGSPTEKKVQGLIEDLK